MRRFYLAEAAEHEWNPAGTGIIDAEYGFPIALATADLRDDLLSRCADNAANVRPASPAAAAIESWQGTCCTMRRLAMETH